MRLARVFSANKWHHSNISYSFQIPSNFRENYLKNAENKKELYKLLVAYLHNQSLTVQDLTVYVTDNETVLSNKGPSFFEPCNHIEADTRVAVFVEHALISGSSKIMVRTGDTDVIFILIGQCKRLLERNPDVKLYLDMQTGSSESTGYLDIVLMAKKIGLQYSNGLPLLHAYTGCDYTPSFYSIGKAKWFNAYISRPDIMELFNNIVQDPTIVQEEEIVAVTRFTLAVYGVDDPSKGLLEGRFDRLTTQKISSFRSLPPSPGAAIAQFRKAVHIAAHIWGKACEPELNPPDMSSPLQGWKRVGNRIEHIWTVQPESADQDVYSTCRKKCGCRRKDKICQVRCSCHDKNLPCLYNCKCRRKCQVTSSD